MLTSGTVTKGVAGFNSVVAPKKDQLEAMTPSDSPRKPSKNSSLPTSLTPLYGGKGNAHAGALGPNLHPVQVIFSFQKKFALAKVLKCL